ncbi:MAG: LysM peptidoglycan-binding domain-containing protein [Solidesulfovibrio sp. DCME]|uniref:LysM peptidoglycan-binding domain-containing protein n=1 Tax=Solidesulfovibrio sp. DCME TaxID=3447380 RepID=UPI003D0F6CED
MPISFSRLLPPVAALFLLALPAWAQTAPDKGQDETSTYTVQSGDTVSRIARKLGLPPDLLIRVNALAHPDRLTPGYVLRLPVTEPPQSAAKAEAAAPAQAPTARLQAPAQATATPAQVPTTPAQATATPAQAPVVPAQAPAAPAQATATPAQAPVVPAQATVTPAQAPVVPAQVPAAPAQAPADTAPPRQPATHQAAAATADVAASPAAPQAPPKSRAFDIDRQAVGVYKHAALGSLRLTQRPEGITLTKDNQDIPMRHLLYAIYDGTDAAGNVHNLQLVYNANGQVDALRYSSAGTNAVTFEKVKK